MRIRLVKKRARFVTNDTSDASVSRTTSAPEPARPQSRRGPAPRKLLARLRRRLAWWTSRKRRTKAVVVTSVTCLVAFVGFLANGITVWDWFSQKARQTTTAGTSSTGAAGAPPVMPTPTCSTCTAGKTFPEQVSPSSVGARAFRNPLAFGGEGQRVPTGHRLRVVCRFQQPDAPASIQPGWWYLIASPPWNRQYYSPANSYLNGDPPQGPYRTFVNKGIPVC